MITKERWLQTYNLVKREFWVLCISFILIFSAVAYLERSGSTTTAAADFLTEYTAAFAEYEKQTGIRLWDGGRKSLIREAQRQGLKTKNEMLALIKKNEKFFKK